VPVASPQQNHLRADFVVLLAFVILCPFVKIVPFYVRRFFENCLSAHCCR